MELVADLHVHSRYSRATSRDLDFVALHRAALEKGIALVGTGDFTHPAWMSEIEEQLEPAEDGLFRLRPDLARAASEGIPAACAGEVRFVLQVEISNIYKKGDRVRKNHNLVFVPSIDAAKRLCEQLAAIGNIASDGRPILGLDARDLLEITLELDPLAFLVPAHIWTPWFSMLGSKSGFDSIEECFGDLAGHVFAGETGLSSDPPMNWRLSQLDRITLISNSDAHSAAKLGREANLLDIDLGYEPLLGALKDGDGFSGTIEFFAEEGKYHLDGHRKCGLRLEPDRTRELGGRCPVCGGPITVGVMSRVLDLADRDEGARPEGAPPFRSFVPLAEAAGEALGVGPATRKARGLVERLLSRVGPELHVLGDAPLEDVRRAGGEVVAEAIRRIREGDLSIEAGYDGEFGTVRIFEPGERERLAGQTSLLGDPAPAPRAKRRTRRRAARARGGAPSGPGPVPGPLLESPDDPLAGLDPDQRLAAETIEGPLVVVAGPGAGKTRTLVARIARQVTAEAVRPDEVLAVAFTNQAADEIAERLGRAMPGGAGLRGALVTTFHGLGLRLLAELRGRAPEIADDEARLEIAREIAGPGGSRREASDLLDRIGLAKQRPDPELGLSEEGARELSLYGEMLAARGLVDLDDLVLEAYRALAGDPGAAAEVRGRFGSISVDEYQDVNDVQAALVALLSPDGSGLCAIGDPDQAIYGFRGAMPGHFARFEETYPGARRVSLGTTYRLTEPVLAAARSALRGGRDLRALRRGAPVEVVECPSPQSEAEQIAVRLERIVGGTSHFAVDSGRGGTAEEEGVGFGDVAVLCRTRAQRPEIAAALGRSGVPCRLVGEDEPHDPRSEKVAVMTMHAAKGREFEVVFATGLEEGLVPLDTEWRTADPEEERRLFYVAVTRARRLAILSHAARRTLFGRALPGRPSPFLEDLPEGAVLRTRAELPRRQKRPSQLDLF